MKDNLQKMITLITLGIIAGSLLVLNILGIQQLTKPSPTSIIDPVICQKVEGKPQWKQEIKIDKSETYTYWGCWIELKN